MKTLPLVITTAFALALASCSSSSNNNQQEGEMPAAETPAEEAKPPHQNPLSLKHQRHLQRQSQPKQDTA